jgi:hypothetical protein
MGFPLARSSNTKWNGIDGYWASCESVEWYAIIEIEGMLVVLENKLFQSPPDQKRDCNHNGEEE